ncbi:MAG: histidinol-phosphate transaminase [Ruminococcaceae bacterium]|nr:histidinol-phosphate transaminase [Oscillospiraceae bacterium]
MSSFLTSKLDHLVPYTPGEQPKDMKYIKLNTNESPFPTSETAQRLALEAASNLQLYSDPECRDLVNTAAEYFGVSTDQIIFTNGSDEVLNFAFMAFCENGAVFPDITYGFYSVFAKLNGVDFKEIPLKQDFSVDINDYMGVNKTVFLANPNAPTGIALGLDDIEKIVKSNPNNVVVIDEAYVDFGAESAISLINKYDNLLVTQTFSKSRSLAGGRLGFGIGSKALIRDLNTIKYSTNPYNVNSMTAAAGIGSLIDDEYIRANCEKIKENREYLVKELKKLDFTMTDSTANFIFAKHSSISGKDIYLRLKEKGVLVRYFDKERLKDYTRITIGSKEQLEVLIDKLKEIIKELL